MLSPMTRVGHGPNVVQNAMLDEHLDVSLDVKQSTTDRNVSKEITLEK